jgi:hypothetical protein
VRHKSVSALREVMRRASQRPPIGSLPSARFEKRLGVLPAADLAVVKKALVKRLCPVGVPDSTQSRQDANAQGKLEASLRLRAAPSRVWTVVPGR